MKKGQLVGESMFNVDGKFITIDGGTLYIAEEEVGKYHPSPDKRNYELVLKDGMRSLEKITGLNEPEVRLDDIIISAEDFKKEFSFPDRVQSIYLSEKNYNLIKGISKTE